MKSILYVGATLMIGASIYGFVNYKKTSRSKEFINMYKENKTGDSETAITLKTTDQVVTKEPVVKEKNTVTKKLVSNDNKTIPAVKPIADNEKMIVAENKKIEDPAVTVNPSKDNVVEKTVTHKRRFSTRLFSRAPLEERYVDKELKLEPKTKTEAGKTVSKDSDGKNKEQ